MGPEETIGTERLVLAPLRSEDAGELAGVLGEPALHRAGPEDLPCGTAPPAPARS